MAFGDYQNEIYFHGLAGVVPKLPMIFAELEAKAENALPPSVWSYVAGGAVDEPAVHGADRSNRGVRTGWPRRLGDCARRRPHRSSHGDVDVDRRPARGRRGRIR